MDAVTAELFSLISVSFYMNLTVNKYQNLLVFKIFI